ncbi:hypothetical protein [Salmonirosea aquatica]|uniref:Uncharacterized protein n=1 Tax=Salmonirosea aquatica TaxID=2654236 RepID=A0A7C9BA10_9BACT|nr:hypothetical protein [Cytophagaceae bacterium SJW1-29]
MTAAPSYIAGGGGVQLHLSRACGLARERNFAFLLKKLFCYFVDLQTFDEKFTTKTPSFFHFFGVFFCFFAQNRPFLPSKRPFCAKKMAAIK